MTQTQQIIFKNIGGQSSHWVLSVTPTGGPVWPVDAYATIDWASGEALFWDVVTVNLTVETGSMLILSSPYQATIVLQNYRDSSHTALVQTITATVNVNLQFPYISLTGTLDFSFVEGDTLSKTLNATVGNVGYNPSTLDWTGHKDQSYVSLAPGSGSLAYGDTEPIVVTVDPTGLTAGVYSGTLDVDHTNPVVPQQTLPITVTIIPFYTGTIQTRWTDTWTIPYPPGNCGWPPVFLNSVTVPAPPQIGPGYRRWSGSASAQFYCYLYVPNNGGQCYIEVWSLPGLIWLLTSSVNVTVYFDANGRPYGSQSGLTRSNYCAGRLKIEWAASF